MNYKLFKSDRRSHVFSPDCTVTCFVPWRVALFMKKQTLFTACLPLVVSTECLKWIMSLFLRLVIGPGTFHRHVNSKRDLYSDRYYRWHAATPGHYLDYWDSGSILDLTCFSLSSWSSSSVCQRWIITYSNTCSSAQLKSLLDNVCASDLLAVFGSPITPARSWRIMCAMMSYSLQFKVLQVSLPSLSFCNAPVQPSGRSVRQLKLLLLQCCELCLTSWAKVSWKLKTVYAADGVTALYVSKPSPLIQMRGQRFLHHPPFQKLTYSTWAWLSLTPDTYPARRRKQMTLIVFK